VVAHNQSNEALSGLVKLLVEYPDGTRAPICCDMAVSAPPQGLSNLLQFDLGAEFPGTLVAVVHGSLGLEGEDSSDSSPVVIGRVFDGLSKEMDFYYGYWLSPPCSISVQENTQFRFWVDGTLIHTQHQPKCDEKVTLNANNVPNLVPGSIHTISVDHSYFDPSKWVYRAFIKWRPEIGIEVLSVTTPSMPWDEPNDDGFYVWDTWHGSPNAGLGNQMHHMEILVLP
jgi:hypothetical protein